MASWVIGVACPHRDLTLKKRGSVLWRGGGVLVLSEKWPSALGEEDELRAPDHGGATSHQETFWRVPCCGRLETRSDLSKAWREVHQLLVAGV